MCRLTENLNIIIFFPLCIAEEAKRRTILTTIVTTLFILTVCGGCIFLIFKNHKKFKQLLRNPLDISRNIQEVCIQIWSSLHHFSDHPIAPVMSLMHLLKASLVRVHVVEFSTVPEMMYSFKIVICVFCFPLPLCSFCLRILLSNHLQVPAFKVYGLVILSQ